MPIDPAEKLTHQPVWHLLFERLFLKRKPVVDYLSRHRQSLPYPVQSGHLADSDRLVGRGVRVRPVLAAEMVLDLAYPFCLHVVTLGGLFPFAKLLIQGFKLLTLLRLADIAQGQPHCCATACPCVPIRREDHRAI